MEKLLNAESIKRTLNCIEKNKSKITEVYTLFKTKYHMVIGYNKISKRRCNVFKQKIQDLTNEASELLSINNNYDEDLKSLCEELIHILEMVKEDMEDWYDTVEEKMNTKFSEDVSNIFVILFN